jgi:hypothetical protein
MHQFCCPFIMEGTIVSKLKKESNGVYTFFCDALSNTDFITGTKPNIAKSCKKFKLSDINILSRRHCWIHR